MAESPVVVPPEEVVEELARALFSSWKTLDTVWRVFALAAW